MKQDLVRSIFSLDSRVLELAYRKFELIPGVSHDTLIRVVETLFDRAKDGIEPQASFLAEAELLAKRVGAPWWSTPERTLVEALMKQEELVPLGFRPLTVAAGSTAHWITSPLVDFDGKRLVIDGGCHVVINDIKIGMCSALAASGPIPGSLFSVDSFPCCLNLPRARIGQQVSINLTNVTGGPLTLHAALLGKACWEESYGHR